MDTYDLARNVTRGVVEHEMTLKNGGNTLR